MTSLINPNNIDITYPIAGQDNDTQGFRTNYQNIQNNFSVAASEISALQSNLSTLQTGVYANANAAAFLTTYTGNISAGNLSVYNLSYVNQETIATTEVVGASLSVTTVVGNTATFSNGTLSTGSFTSSYTDGIVMDYRTGQGRVVVGSGDAVGFYNGGPSSSTLLANVSSVGMWMAVPFILQTLSTTQVSAISPVKGMTVFNTTTGNVQVFNGSKWANIVLS